MSRPSSRMRPVSGVSKPAAMRSRVVFPQPEGPSREKVSPFSMSSVRSLTAVKLPKRRVMFSKRRWQGMISLGCGGYAAEYAEAGSGVNDLEEPGYPGCINSVVRFSEAEGGF